MTTVRAEALTMYGGEQWVINKAIHYNEWVSFTKQEFAPSSRRSRVCCCSSGARRLTASPGSM